MSQPAASAPQHQGNMLTWPSTTLKVNLVVTAAGSLIPMTFGSLIFHLLQQCGSLQILCWGCHVCGHHHPSQTSQFGAAVVRDRRRLRPCLHNKLFRWRPQNWTFSAILGIFFTTAANWACVSSRTFASLHVVLKVFPVVITYFFKLISDPYWPGKDTTHIVCLLGKIWMLSPSQGTAQLQIMRICPL